MTQDIVARIFIFIVLLMYTGIALVFIIAGIRRWIWRPIAKKISAREPQRSYRGIKSTRQEHEGSPS